EPPAPLVARRHAHRLLFEPRRQIRHLDDPRGRQPAGTGGDPRPWPTGLSPRLVSRWHAHRLRHRPERGPDRTYPTARGPQPPAPPLSGQGEGLFRFFLVGGRQVAGGLPAPRARRAASRHLPLLAPGPQLHPGLRTRLRPDLALGQPPPDLLG